MSTDCTVPINTTIPILEPFRTGSYLIFDYHRDYTDHFRRGDDPKLKPETFRASGSRQLDPVHLTARLAEVAKEVKPGGRLHLVDLRQETHLFFDIPQETDHARKRRAVSWYADKDWANVGQSLQWIEADEKSQIDRVQKFQTTQVFCLDPKEKQFVKPTGYSNITVSAAVTEAILAAKMQVGVPVRYLRLPVTDHCPPTDTAVDSFCEWFKKDFGAGDWAHFHCHGGDGRTTTFMAIFDMLYSYKTRPTNNFPSREKFAERQRRIFDYDLDPGCNEKCDWKYSLARLRWEKLGVIRDKIAAGRC